MELGFLDRSSQITPSLVRLYETYKAYSFAKKNKQLTKQLAENQARLKRALDELEAAELAQKQAQQQEVQ